MRRQLFAQISFLAAMAACVSSSAQAQGTSPFVGIVPSRGPYQRPFRPSNVRAKYSAPVVGFVPMMKPSQRPRKPWTANVVRIFPDRIVVGRGEIEARIIGGHPKLWIGDRVEFLPFHRTYGSRPDVSAAETSFLRRQYVPPMVTAHIRLAGNKKNRVIGVVRY